MAIQILGMAIDTHLPKMWAHINSLKPRIRANAEAQPMNGLTNENLWLPGSFNNKRHPVRRLAGPTTADWRGIIAHAEDVLLDSGCLILIISAAKPLVPEPSEHDILNARLSSLIFRKQKQFRRYKKLRIYLQDRNGIRLEVIPNLRATENELRTGLFARQRNRRSSTPIPSPLACFLLRQP